MGIAKNNLLVARRFGQKTTTEFNLLRAIPNEAIFCPNFRKFQIFDLAKLCVICPNFADMFQSRYSPVWIRNIWGKNAPLVKVPIAWCLSSLREHRSLNTSVHHQLYEICVCKTLTFLSSAFHGKANRIIGVSVRHTRTTVTTERLETLRSLGEVIEYGRSGHARHVGLPIVSRLLVQALTVFLAATHIFGLSLR